MERDIAASAYRSPRRSICASSRRGSSTSHAPIPWNQGTVHHIFERGWFWYLPFNNAPKSQNPLASVGLTLDPRLYPRDPSLPPMEDFMSIASRFPDVERQYAGGVLAREWVSTDRVQYSSARWMRQEWTSPLIRLRASLPTAGRKALNVAPPPWRAGACLARNV